MVQLDSTIESPEALIAQEFFYKSTNASRSTHSFSNSQMTFRRHSILIWTTSQQVLEHMSTGICYLTKCEHLNQPDQARLSIRPPDAILFRWKLESVVSQAAVDERKTVLPERYVRPSLLCLLMSWSSFQCHVNSWTCRIVDTFRCHLHHRRHYRRKTAFSHCMGDFFICSILTFLSLVH